MREQRHRGQVFEMRASKAHIAAWAELMRCVGVDPGLASPPKRDARKSISFYASGSAKRKAEAFADEFCLMHGAAFRMIFAIGLECALSCMEDTDGT